MTKTQPASDGAPAWPPGFEIRPRRAVLARELVQAFQGVATAHVSDCLGRSIGARGLLSFHGGAPFCGPAITVRTRPGDNLMVHKALTLAEPGDVIVVDGGGDLSQAVVGGLMRTSAITRGIAAFVIDGAVRDTAEFAEGGFACYALAAVHRGPSKDGPGQINVPIACAGMSVEPGDLILGDADGVVAVPAAEVAGLLDKVREHAAKEERQRAAILAGTTDPERFNKILRQKGVPESLLNG